MARIIKTTLALSLLSTAVKLAEKAGDADTVTGLKAAIEAGKTVREKKPKAEGKATFLDVPKERKDEVKALGAKWFGPRLSWYVPAGVDVTPFTAAGFAVKVLPPVAKKAAA